MQQVIKYIKWDPELPIDDWDLEEEYPTVDSD